MIRWIRAWRRRRKGIPTPGQLAAKTALYRTECARQEAEERAPMAAELNAQLRELRITNHFAERIRLSLEGGR